jgi:hypothetical protein
LNHWQVSGIASFISGQPLPVSYTLVTRLIMTARFDASGNQINTRLGSDIVARAPMEIQIEARFLF